MKTINPTAWSAGNLKTSVTWLRKIGAIGLIVLTALATACSFGGGAEANRAPVTSGQTTPRAIVVSPTPTPTPTPEATQTPVPTPTPASKLSAAQVKQIVFLRVRSCSDQIAVRRNAPLQLVLTSNYSSQSSKWFVDVVTTDRTLTFGEYLVSDATGQVAATDVVSAAIIQPGVTCQEPSSYLSGGVVPPVTYFLPDPTSTPTPQPAPVVATEEDAELHVWVSAYNCYDLFPELASFTAHLSSDGNWVVEGKSSNTQYGLWEVNSLTGEISPLDQLAKEAADKCSLNVTQSSFPAAVTGQEAELLVWIAVYDCFLSKPSRDSFKAYSDNPQRWLVEGKFETQTSVTLYGLWLVDVTTGAITPWDDLAKAMAARPGYRNPQQS